MDCDAVISVKVQDISTLDGYLDMRAGSAWGKANLLYDLRIQGK